MKWVLLIVVMAACSQAPKKGETRGKIDLKFFELSEVWRTDTVLMTPESVLMTRSMTACMFQI